MMDDSLFSDPLDVVDRDFLKEMLNGDRGLMWTIGTSGISSMIYTLRSRVSEKGLGTVAYHDYHWKWTMHFSPYDSGTETSPRDACRELIEAYRMWLIGSRPSESEIMQPELEPSKFKRYPETIWMVIVSIIFGIPSAICMAMGNHFGSAAFAIGCICLILTRVPKIMDIEARLHEERNEGVKT